MPGLTSQAGRLAAFALFGAFAASLTANPANPGIEVGDRQHCRASSLPPEWRWPADNRGERLFRLKTDVDGDSVPDSLEVSASSGSLFGSREVVLTLSAGRRTIKTEASVALSTITAINLVPKEVLDPSRRAALELIEDALFPVICSKPDPSLAWLLDSGHRLNWIEGSPRLPQHYAVRLPASEARSLMAIAANKDEVEGKLDPGSQLWVEYAGNAHGSSGPERRFAFRELARSGEQVLLATNHGVILTNPTRSRHSWIYVYSGGEERLGSRPSVRSARIEGDMAIVAVENLLISDDDHPGPYVEEIWIELTTGALREKPVR